MWSSRSDADDEGKKPMRVRKKMRKKMWVLGQYYALSSIQQAGRSPYRVPRWAAGDGELHVAPRYRARITMSTIRQRHSEG
jgi:hypothetical protein